MIKIKKNKTKKKKKKQKKKKKKKKKDYENYCTYLYGHDCEIRRGGTVVPRNGRDSTRRWII